MPIPKPRKGEPSDEFIGRCMSWMHDNEPERPKKQQLAMCYSSLRTARGKGTAPKKEEQTPGVEVPLLTEEKKELSAAELMDMFVAEVKEAWDIYEASQKEEESWGDASFPDSSFMWVPEEAKGKEGKKSLRKLPVKTKEGKWDLPHVRNALARLPVTQGIPEAEKAKIRTKLQNVLSRLSPGYEPPKKEEQMDTAYCVKCKEKVKIKNPREVKNGVVGVCPKCGTEVHHYRKGE